MERESNNDRIAMLEAVFRSSRDAIGVAREGRHVLVNPAYLALFGFDHADEVIGRGILELIAESARPDVLAHIRRRQASGDAPRDYTTVGLRADGSTFAMDVRVTTFDLDAATYSLVLLRDISDAQRTARALEESNEKFRLISEQALLGIAIIQDDKLIYANEAVSEINGYSVQELQTWTTSDFARVIHPDDLPFALEQARRKQRGDEDTKTAYSYRLITQTGELKHVEQYSKTVSYGGAPADLVTIVDATPRVRAEEAQRQLESQLQHLQKLDAMGSLASGVAHDFGNMLTAIAASAQLALRDTEASHRTRGLLREVLSATERASALTRQLLTFGRKQSTPSQPVDVNKLIDGLHAMLARILGDDISLQTHLQPEVGIVEIDPGQLEQVLVNLSTNARDAMPSGGLLLIETADVTLDGERARHGLREPGAYVRITVSDQGTGMSSATRARIFEPFFTTKAASGGTGLGLSTTWGIVQQHRGWIDVDSELGAGASFSIFLPRAESDSGRIVPARIDEQLPRGRESVWLVEDDGMVRETSVAILRSLGYRVAPFASAGDALVAAERPAADIDLLVTDIVMPHMDGCELSDRMRAMRPSLKVLFNSGYAEGVLLSRGITLDERAFLAKPFEASVLAHKIRTLLDS